MSLRMQPRNEKFFTLFSNAGSNVVESAAVLMAFVAAPHEHWAALAKRMHDTEHTGDGTTHVIIEELDRSFVAPLDPEDIYRLTELPEGSGRRPGARTGLPGSPRRPYRSSSCERAELWVHTNTTRPLARRSGGDVSPASLPGEPRGRAVVVLRRG